MQIRLLANRELLSTPLRSKSSHNAITYVQVTLLINGVKLNPRGPGFWKFNASLLEDKNFVEQVTTKI